jgi:hypothetical protein
MIPLVVFYLHVVFVTGYFTKRWQEEGLGEGLLAVFFSGLIFFVGWSMTSFVVRLIISEQPDLLLNRDNASLLLLTALEVLFYYFYFRGEGDRKPENPRAGTISGEQS